MRKVAVVIFVVFIMSFSASVNAGVGFKAGLNFSKWTGDDIDDLDWKTGIKLGGFMIFPVTSVMTVQPEIYFVTKGWKDKGEILGQEVTITTNMNYIEIPVLLKFNMETGSSFMPMIFVGPYMGFLLGDPTLKVEVGGDSAEEDWPSDTFKSIDLGGVVGAGADFDLGPTTLIFEARYNIGFSSIFDTEDVDVKNMGFSLMCGISF
jgi:hypothetical protein